jgi:hypothetical protein
VTDYFLFYATNELLGLKKMKEAMWKVDERGEFRFSDATDPNQLVLFETAPSLPALRKHILAACSGRDTRVGDVETSVLVKTAFRESHYKGILKTLEKEGRLKIVRASALVAEPGHSVIQTWLCGSTELVAGEASVETDLPPVNVISEQFATSRTSRTPGELHTSSFKRNFQLSQ